MKKYALIYSTEAFDDLNENNVADCHLSARQCSVPVVGCWPGLNQNNMAASLLSRLLENKKISNCTNFNVLLSNLNLILF